MLLLSCFCTRALHKGSQVPAPMLLGANRGFPENPRRRKDCLHLSSLLIHIYVCTIRSSFNGSSIYNTLKQCVVCTESDNMDLISLILLSVLKLSMFKFFFWHFFSICFVCIINNNTISFQMSFLVAIRLGSKMGVLSGRLTITLLLRYILFQTNLKSRWLYKY